MKPLLFDNAADLTINDLHRIYQHNLQFALTKNAENALDQSAEFIQQALKKKQIIYGVNTGFGRLADIRINDLELQQLQHNMVLSHAQGTGKLFEPNIVKLILALKIQTLARGYSGIRRKTVERLLFLLNKQIYPCIPEKGSVGASGDLAPLAHLSLCLIGEGEVYFDQKIISAKEILKKFKLSSLTFAPKEALALLNGTQVSTSLALSALFHLENIFAAAILAGTLSFISAGANKTAFDSKIHELRKQSGQIIVGDCFQKLLQNCDYKIQKQQVQSPYSLRCQPQVMGACWQQWKHATKIIIAEANSVSDNPLVFVDTEEILSCGNFHAQPIAFAADNLALVFAEIGSIAERRIALLNDTHLSGLPAFLVANPGINSGFMIPQVTAAALASENKLLAHPASVDSIPTSANQEDHVSMATFAARRLQEMAENTATIIAIELLAACQGIDFAKPQKLSQDLQNTYNFVRSHSAFYETDRSLAKDIEKIKKLILNGDFIKNLSHNFLALYWNNVNFKHF